MDKDKFRAQLKTFQRKANNLRRYGADVYLLVRRHGRFHEDNSSKIATWPLTTTQLVLDIELAPGPSRRILSSSLRDLLERLTLAHVELTS